MNFIDEPLNLQENMFPINDFSKRTLQFAAIQQKTQNFTKRSLIFQKPANSTNSGNDISTKDPSI
jgi:hypothetical protein